MAKNIKFASYTSQLYLAFVSICALVSGDLSAQQISSGQAQPVAASLRITNAGDQPIHGLEVIFPNETIEFGDVAPGETTSYVPVERGVYDYAAYGFAYGTEQMGQPVMDWMGEVPKAGSFTYQLQFDSARLPFAIRLLQVTRDP